MCESLREGERKRKREGGGEEKWLEVERERGVKERGEGEREGER